MVSLINLEAIKNSAAVVVKAFSTTICFPFSNAFALSRAPRGQEGRYMGFYTMSFSLAHIMSANIGFEVIDNFGYQTNWLVMGTLGLFAAGCAVWVLKMVREE